MGPGTWGWPVPLQAVGKLAGAQCRKSHPPHTGLFSSTLTPLVEHTEWGFWVVSV